MKIESKYLPAYPCTDGQLFYGGINKREYFAAMAIQGYCASVGHTCMPHSMIAKWAVKMADELLKQLESDENNNH